MTALRTAMVYLGLAEEDRRQYDHDEYYADEYDEAYETTSLDLGNVAASGGQTIYRSTDGDGTDEPYYPSR